jgi:4-hydroxybutyrate dehydrogenase
LISAFSFPTAILFGPGSSAALPAKLRELGVERPLVVTDRGLAEAAPIKAIAELLQSQFHLFSGVTGNPTETDVEAAAEAYVAMKCDGVIAVGGGSALDVGKVLRLRIKRPDKRLGEFEPDVGWGPLPRFIAIPTTAGTGSEVGRSGVIVLNGRKQVIFHPALLADLVILEPEFTIGLPPTLTAATGADALTHCIESATSREFHPMCDAIALEGIRFIHRSLRAAVTNGNDIDARGRMLLAATMGGVAFQKDLGAVHSLAHPLSTICGMHHGTANALCLAAVMNFNSRGRPGLYRRVGEAMGLYSPVDSVVIETIQKLLREIGLPPGLGARGVKLSQLETLTAQAWEDGCHRTNPVPVRREDLYRLYESAM